MSESASADGLFWNAVYVPNGEAMMREIAGEIFLVPIRGRLADMQKIFSVNPVAAFIWKQLDGETTLEQIHERLLERFDVESEQAKKDISGFVQELCESGMVEYKQ